MILHYELHGRAKHGSLVIYIGWCKVIGMALDNRHRFVRSAIE
jgi:hypothetical protein